MNIQGIGIISAMGRGIASFEEALQEGSDVPKIIAKEGIPIFSVEDSLLKDKDVLKNSRRADRFCKMAVLAACDAMTDSDLEVEEDEKIGLIVSTAFGPHKTTFNFLDNILDYGDTAVSPTIFSHSVHNAAASYISSALNIRGPVCTLTDFCFPFHEACKLAEAWIEQGRCEYVLTGTVDELSSAMEYICNQKLNISEEGMAPFAFSDKAQTIPGEGSSFFLLGGNEGKSKYCSITCVDEQEKADMFILEADGMIPDESIYGEVDTGDAGLFNCSPLFGGIMSSTSFHCASAALMLKNNHIYSKFAKNLENMKRGDIKDIVSVKYCCNKDKSVFCLRR